MKLKFSIVLLIAIIIIVLVWSADSSTFYKICGYIIKLFITGACIFIAGMFYISYFNKFSDDAMTDNSAYDEGGINWPNARF